MLSPVWMSGSEHGSTLQIIVTKIVHHSYLVEIWKVITCWSSFWRAVWWWWECHHVSLAPWWTWRNVKMSAHHRQWLCLMSGFNKKMKGLSFVTLNRLEKPCSVGPMDISIVSSTYFLWLTFSVWNLTPMLMYINVSQWREIIIVIAHILTRPPI